MSSSPRDPRIDPKAGDVLRKNSLSRRVILVRGLDVDWSRAGEETTIRTAYISTWREWARNAEVLETAP